MKISLNQPNGFPSMYGHEGEKYIDTKNPSIR